MTSIRITQALQPFVLLIAFFVSGCGHRAGGVDIWTAVKNDDAAAVAKYAAAGGDVNVRAGDGSYPLFAALEGEKRAAYAKLLELGADPNIIFGGKLGRVVTNYAAAKCDTYWLRLALDHGGNPNLVNTGASELRLASVLEFALSKGCRGNIQLLIERGADLSKPNQHGVTPLVDALNGNLWEVVLLLLDSGADYQWKDPARPKGTSFLFLLEHTPPRIYVQQSHKDGILAIRRWMEEHGVKLNYID